MLTVAEQSRPGAAAANSIQRKDELNATGHAMPLFQPRLPVDSTDDPLEKEADAMVDKVMRMPEPFLIHRKCADCEEEEKKVHRKPLVSFIQKKEAEVESTANEAITAQIQSTRNGGTPLPEATRSFMESRFETDFSHVRIHTGDYASQLSQQLNAQAFTVGSDIYFDQGKYSPGSSGGKQLLAHELTHTMQQINAVGKKIQKLGANPGCTAAETRQIHQAIFDARGWVNNALAKIDQSPRHARVLPSLRRNFGPTYGVEANLPLITGRIRTAFRALATIPFSCDTPGVTALCAANHCGWAVPGSNAATLCTNPPSTLTIAAPFAIDCVLHESFHASMAFISVDHYSGTAGYPGAGTDPLLNADSYAQFVKELS